MEGDDNTMDMGGGGSGGSGGSGGNTLSSSRWNPTKDQINMLESLYRQGIRTPTAEQIQQITGRLRAFGHIEGKNVFYWFQNHKARQRQKQKQERMALIHHYLHKAPPVFPPSCTNVVCGPYYLPRSDLGFSLQNPNVLLPGGASHRRSSSSSSSTSSGYDHVQQEYHNMMMHSSNYNNEGINIVEKSYQNSDTIDQETLNLFPLHPTGTSLQGRSASDENSATAISSSQTYFSGIEDGVSNDQPLFDFFSGKSD
ncbi:hypothetical protein Ddye_024889 [Dipteronia dyeriana]|uniref:Homeobox domain-containing protein n=1 Tax=Dipteronia dyeriana TaxID=168575 RepID=A0AAD9WU14_9ROSI|nr:hypothetical protein Ddye_024889 [Dipteronia dyeriana]